MRPSLSAAFKFADLFPWCDLGDEFRRSRRPTDAQLQQIRRQCPRWGSMSESERGTRWRVSEVGAVFVVAPNDFIVDVFPLRA